MDTNENIYSDTLDEVIVLGVASTETQGGGPNVGEPFGELNGNGITDE